MIESDETQQEASIRTGWLESAGNLLFQSHQSACFTWDMLHVPLLEVFFLFLLVYQVWGSFSVLIQRSEVIWKNDNDSTRHKSLQQSRVVHPIICKLYI